MLNIRYEHIDKVGSCSFCNRGILNKNGTNLNYPYNHVFVVRGNTVSTRMCRQCVKELKEEL